MLALPVVKNWPRSVQYGIRALVLLLVLLPLTFFASTLGNGSNLVTENAAESTTVPPSPEETFLTLPTGTAVSSTDSTDTTDTTAVPGSTDTTAAAAGSTQPAGPAATRPSGTGTSVMFDAIRNKQGQFTRFASLPSSKLDLNALMVATDKADNGASPEEGQFRVSCEYSHFNYDDPIVFPGQPGKSHLHMFFGNTATDAASTSDSLLNTGGGTCDGFELNRSAYWIPALLDGKGHAVAPEAISIYYKTKKPGEAVVMPQGLKMIAGNTRGAETFTPTPQLHWGCGGSGADYNPTNRIPDCHGDIVNAVIMFPNCWDGVHLDSADHVSHVAFAEEGENCPAAQSKRLPQISILIYWPGQPSVDGWYLSSDKTGSFNTGPGATLHGDWWGGWNLQIAQLWLDHCIKPARNCSQGQTGTSRLLAPLNDNQHYNGPTLLPLPAGAGPGLKG